MRRLSGSLILTHIGLDFNTRPTCVRVCKVTRHVFALLAVQDLISSQNPKLKLSTVSLYLEESTV